MEQTNKKPGFGAKLKNMFGGKKNKKNVVGTTGTHVHGGQVVEEHVHTTTTTTTTTLNQGVAHGHAHHHQHGPLVANPYAQPAHGQIFVPANTAVQANPQTGALLPASSLNGPVILPTGPNMIPIATNYPAGQAGPMVIPPSGGFINNSGNPYLTQQTYAPTGVLPTHAGHTETHYHETGYVDSKAASKLEKEDMKRHKEIAKEEKRLEKDEIRLQKQIEKDQEKMNKQIAKDQEKILKDQHKLETTLEKDQARLQNNQIKLENKLEKNEAKLENKVIEDQMKLQQTAAIDQAAHQQGLYAGQQVIGAPLTTGLDAGLHGTKHVYAEETKQDAVTGQVLDHNVYHKDTRF